MILKKYITYIFFLFILNSCVRDNSAGNQQVINRFIGYSENQLLDRFGPPTQVYKKDDGGKIMSWVFSGIAPSNSTEYNAFTGRWSNVGGSASYSCGFNFYLDKNKIVTSASPTGSSSSCKFN
jgi:hypothetical protein